jgi:predicted DCC family thiol-disulfide oxidoreductase YuxK
MGTLSSLPVGKSVVVYDGECAFCRRAIEAIRVRDRNEQFVYLPRQTSGIEERYPELKLEDFNTGMRLFDSDGRMYIGADAIYEITSKLPYFHWFAWVYRLPLLKNMIRRVYSWIAANRLQLSRYCSSECQLKTNDVSVAKLRRNYQLSRSQMFISALIILILGLHAWANVAKVFFRSSLMGDRSWPFLAYGMYRYSYGSAIIQAAKTDVVGITAAGHEFKLTPEIVGMGGQALGRHYLRRMRSGDQGAARRLAERINIGRDDRVVAFHIQSENFAIFTSDLVSQGKKSETYRLLD